VRPKYSHAMLHASHTKICAMPNEAWSSGGEGQGGWAIARMGPLLYKVFKGWREEDRRSRPRGPRGGARRPCLCPARLQVLPSPPVLNRALRGLAPRGPGGSTSGV